jgi:hypothetical protein
MAIQFSEALLESSLQEVLPIGASLAAGMSRLGLNRMLGMTARPSVGQLRRLAAFRQSASRASQVAGDALLMAPTATMGHAIGGPVGAAAGGLLKKGIGVTRILGHLSTSRQLGGSRSRIYPGLRRFLSRKPQPPVGPEASIGKLRSMIRQKVPTPANLPRPPSIPGRPQRRLGGPPPVIAPGNPFAPRNPYATRPMPLSKQLRPGRTFRKS